MSYTSFSIFFLILNVAVKAKPITETTVFSDNSRSDEFLHTLDTFDLSVVNVFSMEDTFLSVPDIIEKYGFKVEMHQVQTKDGYILEMHRIVGNRTSVIDDSKRQPVFLMHGLLTSSYSWITTGPDHALAYILSNAGYDVWLGNARGTTYSRKHISLNPDGVRSERKKYWNFSWHEIGSIDLPAMIDYILNVTKYKNLHFIGHSQGTTTFFVMASELPEYNDKILSMHAFAPIAFMSNLRNPLLRLAASQLSTLQTMANVMGMYEFFPILRFLQKQQTDCQAVAINIMMCVNEIFLITGYDSIHLNETTLGSLIGHMPAGAATNQLIHYGQEIQSGYFRQFDWGRLENIIKYGKTTPPQYNLKNIRAPVALYYSDRDLMAEPIDVEKLHNQLPNVITFLQIPDFSHVDFILAQNVQQLLFDKVLKTMNEIGNSNFLH